MRPVRAIRRSRALLAGALVGGLLAAGCVSSGRRIETDLVKRIKVGATTRAEVAALLGEPSAREGAGRSESWDYTHAQRGGLGTTRSQRLELRFDNDVVARCQYETFDVDYAGIPRRTASTTCDRL